MGNEPKMLSDVIRVERRFQRSVNLEKDSALPADEQGYILTPTACRALRYVADGLRGEGSHRAITLTGPYGVGKSAFAVFLTNLLCGDETAREWATSQLQMRDADLHRSMIECGLLDPRSKGFLPLLITARRLAAGRCILAGIGEALAGSRSTKLKNAAAEIERFLDGISDLDVIDTRQIALRLEQVADTACSVGYSGVLLVVDELGKLFEFAARDPHRGDVFVLQEIAEATSRSGQTPILFTGLLHQSFDEYGRHVDVATRQRWTKIQGRFTDIAFQEPVEQVMKLVASALTRSEDDLPKNLKRELRDLAKVAMQCGVRPPAISEAQFEEIACRCYPLHPTALVALPMLFNRFAQNERSLFSYLSSLEPGAFQEFLHAQPLDPAKPAFIRLPDLFDYFARNFGAGLYRQPHARRWLEAVDALDRQTELDESDRQIVKTIGVLSVLGDFSHVHATESVIACALADTDGFTPAIRASLARLRESSLLTYRKFNKTYRIWEGSDIDIDERTAEGVRKVGGTGLADMVADYVVTRPMVARRHSFVTGALRYFDLAYVDDPTELRLPPSGQGRADGHVVVCLAESSEYVRVFQQRAKDASEREDILFAIPMNIGNIRAAALELAALRWTWDNTPELRDDRVARREVALRITEAEQVLLRALTNLLNPQPEPAGSSCLYYWKGVNEEVGNRAEVSQLLSKVCDRLYKDSPHIRNELLIRRSLSSAAAAARRNVIEAMLAAGNKPVLGIEGFPPERSMYESVLLATGLHREAKNGECEFAAPTDAEEHNLGPAWKFLRKTVFEAETEPMSVDKLFDLLSAPPFGIIDGLQPVLLCAFMLVHPDETTLYREGTFLPEPGIADYEVMLRRPELFAISGSRATAGRRALLERMGKSLGVSATTVSIVRALFKRVNGLPGFAWRTRKMDEDAIRTRAAFENASSPEQFLYKALPEAVGLKAFVGRELDKQEVETFFGSLNKALQVWAAAAGEAQNSAIECLLRSCGIEPDEAGWQHLREMSLRIEPSVTDTNLLAFVRRVVQSGPESDGILGVLALIANRPPDSWSDSDVERFPGAAKAIGKAFQAAVRTVGLGGSHAKSIKDLPEGDRKAARNLLQSLRERVRQYSNASSAEIARAVLNELESEIEELISGKGAR